MFWKSKALHFAGVRRVSRGFPWPNTLQMAIELQYWVELVRKHVSLIWLDRWKESLLQPKTYVHKSKPKFQLCWKRASFDQWKIHSIKKIRILTWRQLLYARKAGFIKRLVLLCMYECTWFCNVVIILSDRVQPTCNECTRKKRIYLNQKVDKLFEHEVLDWWSWYVKKKSEKNNQRTHRQELWKIWSLQEW